MESKSCITNTTPVLTVTPHDPLEAGKRYKEQCREQHLIIKELSAELEFYKARYKKLWKDYLGIEFD